MKKLSSSITVTTLFVILATIIALFSSSAAMAETISVPATETKVAILSRNDNIIGVYYDANVDVDRNDAAKLNGNDIFVKSVAAKGALGSNRYQRSPRFANGEMNMFYFSGTWVDEEAYIAFNGDAQALLDATKVTSEKRNDYSTHRLWNRFARPVAITVFTGNLGGREIEISYILKNDVRVYGIELLEQTVVNTTVHVEPTIEEQPPVVQPTIEEQEPELPEQPQEPQEPQQPEQPIVTPTIEEEPVVTVQETPAGEGYTTGTVGGRRR